MRDIRPEVLDELLSGYKKPSDLFGGDGIFRQLKKRLLERALNAELSEHVGYAKGERSGRRGANNRNGHTAKTVLTDEGTRAVDGAVNIAPLPSHFDICFVNIPTAANASFASTPKLLGQSRSEFCLPLTDGLVAEHDPPD